MPLVSVVVPAYNAESTVLETIASVRRQTLTDWELVVVDDGSTDTTLELLRGISDPRVRVLTGGNQGVAAARNRGVAATTGRFVSFLDADDLWTADKLERQVEAICRRGADAVVYSWTAFIDDRGDFLFAKERSWLEGDVYTAMLLDFFVASASNVLVPRRCLEAVGGFDTTLECSQDLDLCLRLAKRWPYAVVPRYQVLYRIWSAAMSADAQLCERASLGICERAFAGRPELSAARREAVSNIKQYSAMLYLSRAGGPQIAAEAGKKLRECVRLYPRTLLRFKTLTLVLTRFVLFFVPARLHRATVLGILRGYGRWLALIRPEVREVVDQIRAWSRARQRPAGEERDRHADETRVHQHARAIQDTSRDEGLARESSTP